MHSQHSSHPDSQEHVVHDVVESCPYLPDQSARMPLRYRALPLTQAEFDQHMESGQRRSGPFMYRPACPSCRACEAIRVEAAKFEFNRTQRRVWQRGRERIEVTVVRPVFDAVRLELFNRHRQERDLARNEGDVSAEGYQMFLVESCCDTWEIDYTIDGRLAGVAICDRGAQSLSAVYCYYDPDFSQHSLGVFSVLMQVELCRSWELKYLYLGYYVAGCSHMSYKQSYKPHERLIGGAWQPFERT